MPYIVKKTGQCPASRPYGVFTETAKGSGTATGKPHGCFPTQAAAREQQKALYANVPDANSAGAAPEEASMSTTEPQVRLPHMIAYRRDKRPRRGELEHRTMGIDELELRKSEKRIFVHDEEAGEEPRTERLLEFDGYASLFNRSYRVGPYTEEISSGAFKRSLGNPNLDVVLRTEHNGLPLARTTGRITLADGETVPTLQLSQDDTGLRTRALLDPTDPDVQRLVPKYRRGDLKEMSFAFRVGKGGDEWSDDYSHRTVNAADIHRGDVSIVTYGASPTTASSIRSEELASELRSVGPEGLVSTLHDFAFAWVANHMQIHGQRETVEKLEERIGKVLSSDSMDTLRQVLQLASDASGSAGEASDATDEAQALLADLMGVPDPTSEDGESDGGSVTDGNGQLAHVGRTADANCLVCEKAFAEGDSIEVKTFRADGSDLTAGLCHADCEPPEQRNDPTGADWAINCDLKSVKQAIASAKASQLQDPDLGDDSDDAAVMSALEDADTAIDRALVAQGKDIQYEDGDNGGMLMYSESDPEREERAEAESVPARQVDLDEAEFELRMLGRRR